MPTMRANVGIANAFLERPRPQDTFAGISISQGDFSILRMGYQKWGFLAFPGNQASSGADSSGDLDGIENGVILHDVKTCHNMKKAPGVGNAEGFHGFKNISIISRNRTSALWRRRVMAEIPAYKQPAGIHPSGVSRVIAA